MCEQAARNFCRKGTEMPQKTRKNKEKAGKSRKKAKEIASTDRCR